MIHTTCKKIHSVCAFMCLPVLRFPEHTIIIGVLGSMFILCKPLPVI